MPIYEYECEACGHRDDILQKAGDLLLTVCPECSRPALRKLVSAAGFRLSGSGWYETDFKSDNKRNLTSRDSQKKSEGKDKGTRSDKKQDVRTNQSSKARSTTSGSGQDTRAS